MYLHLRIFAMLKLAISTSFLWESAYKLPQMLKTFLFLRKTIFFNTFLVFFALTNTQNVHAQSTQHGASFELAKEIRETSSVYQNLKVSDSSNLQVKGTITEVCQAKGCWMKVSLADSKEVFVKFKDYGFFVPTDAAGKNVVMNGLAFVEEMTVEDQRHYAQDKGATKEEVAKITEPKRTLRFEADGVRISN
jgi:hypothetical protein